MVSNYKQDMSSNFIHFNLSIVASKMECWNCMEHENSYRPRHRIENRKSEIEKTTDKNAYEANHFMGNIKLHC